MYYRARFYDPNLGRFISEDPIGFEGGDVNLYGDVWNDPLQFRDPYGLYPFDYPWVYHSDDEQVWRAQQDLIEAAAPAIRYGIGFGDTTLFGVSRSIRQWQGIDDPTLDCSVAYQAVGWTAIGVQAAMGGVGLYRGGLSLATQSAGPRVFWSGRNLAKNAAADFARTTGGTTLEMTAGGRAATWLDTFLPNRVTNPLWRDLSASFARGARGSADTFHNAAGVPINGTWATVEYGILTNNGVRITYHTVFR